MSTPANLLCWHSGCPSAKRSQAQPTSHCRILAEREVVKTSFAHRTRELLGQAANSPAIRAHLRAHAHRRLERARHGLPAGPTRSRWTPPRFRSAPGRSTARHSSVPCWTAVPTAGAGCSSSARCASTSSTASPTASSTMSSRSTTPPASVRSGFGRMPTVPSSRWRRYSARRATGRAAQCRRSRAWRNRDGQGPPLPPRGGFTARRRAAQVRHCPSITSRRPR